MILASGFCARKTGRASASVRDPQASQKEAEAAKFGSKGETRRLGGSEGRRGGGMQANVYMYVPMYLGMNGGYMYVPMYLGMNGGYRRMYICMYLCTYVPIYLSCMYANECVWVCTRMYMYLSGSPLCRHTLMHALFVYMHAHLHTYTHSKRIYKSSRCRPEFPKQITRY